MVVQFTDISEDLLFLILRFVPLKHRPRLERVSKAFQTVLESVWRQTKSLIINEYYRDENDERSEFGGQIHFYLKECAINAHAVKHSIILTCNLNEDKLIDGILKKLDNLKTLRIYMRAGISDEILRRILDNFDALEHFELETYQDVCKCCENEVGLEMKFLSALVAKQLKCIRILATIDYCDTETDDCKCDYDPNDSEFVKELHLRAPEVEK